jgi:hypothetical protein
VRNLPTPLRLRRAPAAARRCTSVLETRIRRRHGYNTNGSGRWRQHLREELAHALAARGGRQLQLVDVQHGALVLLHEPVLRERQRPLRLRRPATARAGVRQGASELMMTHDANPAELGRACPSPYPEHPPESSG